jgi:ApbE superfamily uncharacterized protein (UPF0280 family)
VAKVELLREGVALADSGPLYAGIHVSARGCPLSEAAMNGGRYALGILEQLAPFTPVVKRKTCTLQTDSSYPRVVNEMILATQRVEDPDFTPLAAVAGALADLVADYLAETTNATKIIIDNGGDISIRLREGDHARVGLRPDVAAERIDYVVPVERDCGICTSGLGGRSFTLGVASAVTVLAERASLADAVATYLGNKTTIDSQNVAREWAEKIDPETDIPGKKVTTHVGAISQAEIQGALQNGYQEAIRLVSRGTIWGAAIAVKGNLITTGMPLQPARC